MTLFRKNRTATSRGETHAHSDHSNTHSALHSLLETLDGGEGWMEYRSGTEAWWYPGQLGHLFRVIDDPSRGSALCLDIVLFERVVENDKLYENLNAINTGAGLWWVWYDRERSQVTLSAHASLDKTPVFMQVRGTLWCVEASYAAETIATEWSGRIDGKTAKAGHTTRGPRPNRDGWLLNVPTAPAREGSSALPVVVTDVEHELLVAAASVLAPGVHFSSSRKRILTGDIGDETRIVVAPCWHAVAGYGLRSVVAIESRSLVEVAALNKELAQTSRRLERPIGAGAFVVTTAGTCFTTFVDHFTLENWATKDLSSAVTSWSGAGLLGIVSVSPGCDTYACLSALLEPTLGSDLVLGDEDNCSTEEPLLSTVVSDRVGMPIVLSYRITQRAPDSWDVVEHYHHSTHHNKTVLRSGSREVITREFSEVVKQRFSKITEFGMPLPHAAHARSEVGREALVKIALCTEASTLRMRSEAHKIAGVFTATFVERVAVLSMELLQLPDADTPLVASLEDAQGWAKLVSDITTVDAATLHLRVATEGWKVALTDIEQAAAITAAVQELQLRRLVLNNTTDSQHNGGPAPISWDEVLFVAVSPLLIYANAVTHRDEWVELGIGPLTVRIGVEKRLAEDPQTLRVTSEIRVAEVDSATVYTHLAATLQQQCGVGSLRIKNDELQSFGAVKLTPTGRYVLQSFAGWLVAQVDEAAAVWKMLKADAVTWHHTGVSALSTPLPVDSLSVALYGSRMSGKWLPERWPSIRRAIIESLSAAGVTQGYMNYEVTYFGENTPDLAMELHNTPHMSHHNFYSLHGPGLLLRARVLPPAGPSVSGEDAKKICDEFNDRLLNSSEHVFVGFSPLGCQQYGINMTAYVPAYVIGPEWYDDEMLAGCIGNFIFAHLASAHFIASSLNH